MEKAMVPVAPEGTVAVNVTAVLTVEGLAEEIRVTVPGGGELTVWVSGVAEEGEKLESPL